MVAPNLTINAGITINAGVTLNGFAPSTGPSVTTQTITAWDPDYIGPNLTICAPGTWSGPQAGQLELAATQSENSSGLAYMDGGGSLFDYGPLIMFTMYVNPMLEKYI